MYSSETTVQGLLIPPHMSQGSICEWPGCLSGILLPMPLTRDWEGMRNTNTNSREENRFVHRKQQLLLPLRTDAQPQAVLHYQGKAQQRIQTYSDWILAWLFLGSTQHLLDVGQRVALGEVVGMALPEHVSHSTAGNNLQAATTHPHSERELWKRSQESYSCNSPDKGNFLALLL